MNGASAINFTDDASAGDFSVLSIKPGAYNGGTNEIQTLNTTNLHLKVGVNDGIFLATDGDVGIGTTTPTEKLEVDGKIKIGAITLPNTDGNGKPSASN